MGGEKKKVEKLTGNMDDGKRAACSPVGVSSNWIINTSVLDGAQIRIQGGLQHSASNITVITVVIHLNDFYI